MVSKMEAIMIAKLRAVTLGSMYSGMKSVRDHGNAAGKIPIPSLSKCHKQIQREHSDENPTNLFVPLRVSKVLYLRTGQHQSFLENLDATVDTRTS